MLPARKSGSSLPWLGASSSGRKRLHAGLQEEISAAGAGDGSKQAALESDQLRIVVAVEDGIHAGRLGLDGGGAG